MVDAGGKHEIFKKVTVVIKTTKMSVLFCCYQKNNLLITKSTFWKSSSSPFQTEGLN